MRRADRLRVRKEVGMDVARSLITEIENLVRQRRLLSEEINAISSSIERERRRVPELHTLRTEFQRKLVEFGEKMRLEHRRLQETLDEVEAGPSHAVIPHVSRHAKQRESMNRDQRAVKRTKAGAPAPGSGSNGWKPWEWNPPDDFFVITRYVEVKCRLILRDVVATVERNGQNEVIERAMLNSIERFWLCIKRWQYLQTRKVGKGVRGARRGTRIRDVAQDLNVPANLATLYRYANGEKNLWYPPATVDLRVAEREGNRTNDELWPWVLEKEGNLGWKRDVSDGVEDDEDEDMVEDDQEEDDVEVRGDNVEVKNESEEIIYFSD